MPRSLGQQRVRSMAIDRSRLSAFVPAPTPTPRFSRSLYQRHPLPCDHIHSCRTVADHSARYASAPVRPLTRVPTHSFAQDHPLTSSRLHSRTFVRSTLTASAHAAHASRLLVSLERSRHEATATRRLPRAQQALAEAETKSKPSSGSSNLDQPTGLSTDTLPSPSNHREARSLCPDEG